jgi:hypothetical protein
MQKGTKKLSHSTHKSKTIRVLKGKMESKVKHGYYSKTETDRQTADSDEGKSLWLSQADLEVGIGNEITVAYDLALQNNWHMTRHYKTIGIRSGITKQLHNEIITKQTNRQQMQMDNSLTTPQITLPYVTMPKIGNNDT